MSKREKNYIFMKRLKQRRIELNLKQSELEDMYNFGKGTISQYERGERFPQDIQSLAKALGVYENWLTGKSDIKDFQESIHKLANSLMNIGSIKDRKRIYDGYNSFIESLGYKMDSESPGTWSVTTTKEKKYINSETGNNLIDNIINSTREYLDSVENDEKAEEKAKNYKPDLDLFYEDPTINYTPKNLKEGDSMIE